MPESLGTITKPTILISESHKLALEFQAGPNIGTITFSADLITGDDVNLTIQGDAITQVSWASSHANTMGLIVTALKATDYVQDAKIDPDLPRVIHLYLKDDEATPVMTGSIAHTGGTATMTLTTVANDILQGMPVGLIGDGEKVVSPVILDLWWGATFLKNRLIGVSIHYALAGQLCTVFAAGYMVVYGKLTGTKVPGPAKATTVEDVVMTPGYEFGYVNYDATTSVNDHIGWMLDGGDNDDIVRVLLAL